MVLSVSTAMILPCSPRPLNQPSIEGRCSISGCIKLQCLEVHSDQLTQLRCIYIELQLWPEINLAMSLIVTFSKPGTSFGRSCQQLRIRAQNRLFLLSSAICASLSPLEMKKCVTSSWMARELIVWESHRNFSKISIFTELTKNTTGCQFVLRHFGLRS